MNLHFMNKSRSYTYIFPNTHKIEKGRVTFIFGDYSLTKAIHVSYFNLTYLPDTLKSHNFKVTQSFLHNL